MSEKLTFQELIESIAEETDHSKQFTRDFIKDFVEVINNELKHGDDINVAGFGKFKLQQVDEREGYNPQTEEKMTIPAHHKMIFKPYKDLREVVNVPYAHLEPTLIDDEKNDPEPVVESNQQSTVKNDEKEPDEKQHSVIDEFESLLADDSDEEKSAEEAPEALSFTSGDFMPDDEKDEDNIAKSAFSEEDIVEYHDEPATDEDETDEHLAEFMGSEEDESNNKEGLIDNVNYSQASPLGAAFDDENKADNKKTAISPVEAGHQSSKKSSTTAVLAAVILLLIIAAGAWYFSTLSKGGRQQITSRQLISATTVSSKNANSRAQQVTANQPASSKRVAKSGTNASPQQLVIAKGATLWSIAEARLGNPRLWPWIYDTNESIENPDLIFAGATLSVPRPSGIPTGLSETDSIAVAKGYVATYRWYKSHRSPKAKNYLWAARKYHEKIVSLANIQIDKADLSFTNKAR
ncbi:MAG TPA: HU family DNA-binding protein [Balneolaceae bacterium]|nr:HU family DNA-binding protein [Balneolaceae bacterium]